jgi:hypothetical protein
LIEYFLKSWQEPERKGPAMAGRRKPCTVLVQGKHRRDIHFYDPLLAFRQAQLLGPQLIWR